MIPPRPDDEFRRLVREATELRNTQQHALATPLWRQILELRPKEAKFLDQLGRNMVSTHGWAEGATLAERAIAEHGITTERLNRQALCLVRDHRDRAALTILQSAEAAAHRNEKSELLRLAASLWDEEAGPPEERLRALLRRFDEPKRYLAFFRDLLRPKVAAGQAVAVLRLARTVLALDHPDPSWMRLGLLAAGACHDWTAKLELARQLHAAEPEKPLARWEEIDALIALGRTSEAEALLAAMDRSEPPDAKRFQQAWERIERRAAWAPRLLMTSGDDFASINLGIAVSTALRDEEAAIAWAERGMRRHGRHPWFLGALAACEMRRGRPRHALPCLIEAAASGSPFHLARLCQAQIQLGEAEAARQTLRRLEAVQPSLPALARLRATIGASEPPPPAPAPEARPGSWLHAGDMGDVAYALAAMKAGGGGVMYLTPFYDTRDVMDQAKLAFLRPLLLAQPYVEEVALWQGEAIDRDFVALRTGFGKGSGPGFDLLSSHWQSVLHSAPDLHTPWLVAPGAERHGRPVLARSPRYRNPRWEPFWQELKARTPDAIFVGSNAEFAEFGHGEHCLARDALEIAQVIAGASVFIGNQSFPYALAEGLKVGRLLEVSSEVPNCTFPGALALTFA